MNTINKSNSILSDVLDLTEIENILNHYVIATGFNVSCFDNNGEHVLSPSACENISFCEAVNRTKEGRLLCKKSHCYGGEKSYELGEPYIYACDLGLILCSVPLIYEDKLIGSISSGPVLLWEADEFTIDELFQKTKHLGLSPQDIASFSSELKEIHSTNMHSAAQLLYAMLSYVLHSSMQNLSQKRSISHQQQKIAELLIEKKKEQESSLAPAQHSLRRYPIELEKKLIDSVQTNDVTGAKKIMNDLLSEIFFQFSGNLSVIKARLLELMSVISRAAVDAGAPFSNCLICSLNFLKT